MSRKLSRKVRETRSSSPRSAHLPPWLSSRPAASRGHVARMFPAFRLSRMHGGVFYGETFGSRGSVEVPVGRNQRYRPEPGIPLEPVHFEDDSQLYGIVSPEPVLAGCQHRLGKEGRSQFHDAIALGQVAAEMPEHRAGLGGRKVAAVLPASDRGSDLNSGDAGDIERVSRLVRTSDLTQGLPASIT